jgi:hypothetical protein
MKENAQPVNRVRLNCPIIWLVVGQGLDLASDPTRLPYTVPVPLPALPVLHKHG